MHYPFSLPSTEIPLLIVSHPKPHLWLVELRNGLDNRLTAQFLQKAFLPALDHVELAWRNARKIGKEQRDPYAGKGALVITGNLKQNKFFSNGLDFDAAISQQGFFYNVFHPWIERLVTFPIPLVAAINGHAFAGGWILGAACDYRIMSSGKCWACMNEVHLGSDFPHATMVFLRTKSPNPTILRKLVQEGHRWTPQELLAEQMVDEIVDGGNEVVLERALALAERCSDYAKTGVYGLIKKGTNREFIDAAKLDPRLLLADEEENVARSRIAARARL
ncbi:ClpP/crotonase [Ramaria rubella]|nr:ClpP/crotonase [Ramaria rubella]